MTPMPADTPLAARHAQLAADLHQARLRHNLPPEGTAPAAYRRQGSYPITDMEPLPWHAGPNLKTIAVGCVLVLLLLCGLASVLRWMLAWVSFG